MGIRWGEWVGPPPLNEPDPPVTLETCEFQSRLTRAGDLWDAAPVHYRTYPGGLGDPGRLAAWARPRGRTALYVALAYHGMCDVKPDNPFAHQYSPSRWRVLWVIYDPALIQQSAHYAPSRYWQEQLSQALAAFADTWHLDPRPPVQRQV